MAEWVQIDLLDLIAEEEERQRKERTKLCPVLEEWSNQYIKQEQQLCKGWKNAIKNDVGVYTTNTVTIPSGTFQKRYLALNLALDNETVYGSLSLNSTMYGRGSPVTGENDLLEFSIYKDIGDAMLDITYKVNGVIMNDPNLDEKDKQEFFKLVEPLITKTRKTLIEYESLPTTP